MNERKIPTLISYQSYYNWLEKKWQEDKKKGARFGQSFMNNLASDAVDHELFYENDWKVAKAIIEKLYLTT